MLRLLTLPIHFILIVLLLPITFLSKVINVLSDLAEMAPIDQLSDISNIVDFLRNDPSDERRRIVLADKFPNSIAVRS